MLAAKIKLVKLWEQLCSAEYSSHLLGSVAATEVPRSQPLLISSRHSSDGVPIIVLYTAVSFSL